MAIFGIYDDGTLPHAVDYMLDIMGGRGAARVWPGAIPRTLKCLMVPGGDKGVRKYYLDTDAPSIPVLGVSEGETGGLLAQVDVKDIQSHIERLQASSYTIDEIPRLRVEIDGRIKHNVLNDATVCSAKSAMLMEYLLTIDGEEFWHDSSDGIIVSTPWGPPPMPCQRGGR